MSMKDDESDMLFRIGAISGCMAVALGAFGAHGLKNMVKDVKLLKTWETAAQYQMYHAGALCLSALVKAPLAGKLFLGGTALFSGSLYALVLSNVSKLGAITPVGGISLILGWLALAYKM